MTKSSAATLDKDSSSDALRRETAPLPVKPVVTIESTGSFSPNLRHLWAYRELLYFLTWRDVKVRYKQTALGVAWAILQPLSTMLIFTLLFGRLAGIGSRTGGIPYPIFAYAGLLPWIFFSNSINNSGNSVVSSAHLITKVYFPRIIIPSAAVAAGLVDFAISFAIMAALMVYYRVALTFYMLMLPPLILLITALALAVGMWLAALNVKYRDVRFALPFLIQLWMFVSPVIYPLTFVPERWHWLLLFNPLTGIIEGFRASLFGNPFNWNGLAISTAMTLALMVYSAYNFRRMEKRFADIV
jgi:lipopolysaccharide transport system permease protein